MRACSRNTPARCTTERGRVMARDDEERRQANLRLALILASVAAVLFIGFIAKTVWLGH